MTKVPVVLIFYKRQTVLKVIEQIKKYEPEKLFLISDGGKSEPEHQKCIQIRDLVENSIDWNCKIYKLFNDKNLGCREGIPKGIDWVFSQVDQAIILEDDCVPSPSFFLFCEEMLTYYVSTPDIWTISGSNYLPSNSYFEGNSYLFSGYAEQCGWATWKRAWNFYDKDMKTWPEAKKHQILKSTFLPREGEEYWASIFQQVYDKTCSCDPYDYQWLFESLSNKALSIVPEVNLISNIGYTSEATHVINMDSPLANNQLGNLIFPLRHPQKIIRNEKFDYDYGKLVFGYPKNVSRHAINVLISKALKIPTVQRLYNKLIKHNRTQFLK